MKIAIDISQISYENTGVANYTRDLVTNLLKYDKSNQYILFAYSLRRMAILENFFQSISGYENVTFHPLKIPQTLADFIWNGIHRLSIEKLIGEIDIYHSSDWIQIPSRAKKITTIHDLVVYRFPQTSDSRIINTQKKRLLNVKSECDFILADSQATKRDIIDILKIDAKKVDVVYPGINDSFIQIGKKSAENILKKYNIIAPFVLAVGKNDPRKNLERVINSFDKLTIPLKLLIISSDGWGKKLPENNRIQILKKIDSSDLPAIYSKAQMLVYPSLYEGFGLPVIEAMACGAPVITSDRGSLKEVAQNSALFVNPESENDIARKIMNLYRHKKLREKLIVLGFKNAKRFSWQKTAKEIIKVYNKL